MQTQCIAARKKPAPHRRRPSLRPHREALRGRGQAIQTREEGKPIRDPARKVAKKELSKFGQVAPARREQRPPAPKPPAKEASRLERQIRRWVGRPLTPREQIELLGLLNDAKALRQDLVLKELNVGRCGDCLEFVPANQHP